MSLDDQWAGKRGKCKSCGQIVQVPGTAVQRTVPAPRPATSSAPAPAAAQAPASPKPSVPAPSIERLQQEIAGAFDGQIPRIRTPLMYRFGILVVCLVMVLLPAIYVALIGLVGYGVYYHLVNHTGMLHVVRGRAAAMVLLAYVAPLIVGSILVVFMIKPLFARPAQRPRTRSLTRDGEPLLFDFVDRVCHAVRAPRPRRIDVDCEVNASASFRRGLWSVIIGRDLVLTIGMPLVAGLSARQFGGVLGHEFGHFGQGAGMRLTYVIRSINYWFTRVVYERDSWDQWLAETAEGVDLRFGWVLYLARLCVWLSRRILWVLMMVGHAVSSFMLRQMEFDADKHETHLVGSETFESSCRRLTELGLAHQKAHSDMSGFYREGRLGDNLPRLTRFNADQIDKPLAAKLRAAVDQAKTGLFDTHPSDNARIAAARAENAPGILTIDRPASELFVHYDAICRNVTWDFYRSVFGPQFQPSDMHPMDDLLTRQEQEKATYGALDRFFLGQFSLHRPIRVPDVQIARPDEPQAVLQSLRGNRKTLVEMQAEYAKLLESYKKADSQHMQGEAAKSLFTAEVPVQSGQFEYPVTCRGDARQLIEQAETTLSRLNNRMTPFEDLMGQRLFDSLCLLHVSKVSKRVEDAARHQQDAARLLPMLQSLRGLMDQVTRLRNESVTLGLMLQYLQGNESNQALISAVLDCAHRIHGDLVQIHTRTTSLIYPFDHAEGEISLARYLVSGIPAEEQVGHLGQATEQLVDRFTGLYARVLARLAQTAECVEQAIGLKPLQVPEVDHLPPSAP